MNIKLNLDLKNIDEEIHKLDILDRDTIIQLYVLSLKRIDRLNNIINELKKIFDKEDYQYLQRKIKELENDL